MRAAPRRDSLLVVAMLRRPAAEAYPHAKVIHVVPDHFSIHDPEITRAAVAEPGGRVRLHSLPPYRPQANRIERAWLGLHANVTRDHRCADMDELMRNVGRHLIARNARIRTTSRKAA